MVLRPEQALIGRAAALPSRREDAGLGRPPALKAGNVSSRRSKVGVLPERRRHLAGASGFCAKA